MAPTLVVSHMVSHMVVFHGLLLATFPSNFARRPALVPFRRGQPFCHGLGLLLQFSPMAPLGTFIGASPVYGTLWLRWQGEWSLLLLGRWSLLGHRGQLLLLVVLLGWRRHVLHWLM